ncbi:MAG: response regulator transcription factor [Deltaproteobacteria bacterium]
MKERAIRIRIVLADDHKITRQGLLNMLRDQRDMEVVGEAANGHGAVTLAKELSPNVVIMDVSMPDLNGISATRRIVSESSNSKVIGLSMHSDKRFVKGMFEAGASGYLLKDCAFEELVQAIQTVANNQVYLSPSIASIMIEEVLKVPSDKETSKLSLLTDREREIVQLLAEGKSTKDIAYRLNLSVKTIESHRRRIMERLEIQSIAELTKFAIKEGLTSLD